VRLEELGQLKSFNDLNGNRIRHLPAFSVVPQSTTLPRAPAVILVVLEWHFDVCENFEMLVYLKTAISNVLKARLMQMSSKCLNVFILHIR
jgi:hypothetical protein